MILFSVSTITDSSFQADKFSDYNHLFLLFVFQSEESSDSVRLLCLLSVGEVGKKR